MWRSLLKTVVWPVPGQLRIFVFIPVVLCDQTLTGVDSSYYNGKGCGYCCVWKSGGIWHDRMVPAVYGSDDHTESSNQSFTCPFPQSGDPTDRGGAAGRVGEKAAASVDPVS